MYTYMIIVVGFWSLELDVCIGGTSMELTEERAMNNRTDQIKLDFRSLVLSDIVNAEVSHSPKR